MKTRLWHEHTALLLFCVVSGVWSHAGHHGHLSLDHQHNESQDLDIGGLHIGGVHFQDRDDFINRGGRCGVAEPSHTDKLKAAEVLRKYRQNHQHQNLDDKSREEIGPSSNRTVSSVRRRASVWTASGTPLTASGQIRIETWIHEIISTSGQGFLNLKQINSQIAALNNAYANTGVSFYLAGVTCTASDAWYDPRLSSATNQQMKTMLRRGKRATLNIFIKPLVGLLGYASMPGWYNKYWWDDGVVIIPTSTPGGSAFPYNLGYTAVHEVGHWLGLYHPFQGNSCSGVGDHVSDTPIQSTYTMGCPVSKDSCPLSAGQDSIHNYMDYADDACMNTFTAGQAEMIAAMWQEYRLRDSVANFNPQPVQRITCQRA